MGDDVVAEDGRVVVADLDGVGSIGLFVNVCRRTYGIVQAYLQVCYDYQLPGH